MWSLETWVWYILKTTINGLLKVFTMVAPATLVEQIAKNEFEKQFVRVVAKGAVEETNQKLGADKKWRGEIIVKDPRFYRRLINDNTLALGEAYMDDWIEIPDPVGMMTALGEGYNMYNNIPGLLHEKWEQSWDQHTRELSMKVIEEHYNLGNDLYKLMLDKTMNYTCAYYTRENQTLYEAQIAKMDLVARKLKLKAGMKVLDLGCGFGGCAKYLAERYQVSVVGYNISKEQVAFAREQCRGLDVEFRLADYRTATGQYDAVYSIGFFEHVGHQNYRDYFNLVDRCLKPGGLTLLQSLCVASRKLPRILHFYSKYIFPGGQVPYMDEFLTAADGIVLIEDYHNLGDSYKRTLLEWHQNFVKNWPELKAVYGPMMGGKFYPMWEFYLLMGAAGFNARQLNLVQAVYSKGLKGSYVSER